MQAQEDEISALRRQLDSMQVASSRARAGGAGRRQYDGTVPAEYICPITQVMKSPGWLRLQSLSYQAMNLPQPVEVGIVCKVTPPDEMLSLRAL